MIFAGFKLFGALALAPPGPGTLVDSQGPVVWTKEAILFSACNEDGRSELRALEPLAGKDVFCVTAGGGRVLNLLLGNPRSIHAVDINPAQNALLELKVAALRELDHDGFLRFLGVREDGSRKATYACLRRLLSDEAARFFDRKLPAIQAGMLYQGRLERFLKLVATLTRLVRPLGLQALLDATTVEEQRALVDRIDGPVWRAVTETLARRSVLRVLSGDPGFFRYLPLEMKLHKVLVERVHEHLRHNLLMDSALLQLVFFGRYVKEESLPPYLHALTFEQVKGALAGVHLKISTGSAEQALATAGPACFDAFSISDISSYLDDDAHHRLFEGVFRSARPGARLCSRANLHHRPLHASNSCRIRRDPELERELAIHDHACVHEFVVGSIG